MVWTKMKLQTQQKSMTLRLQGFQIEIYCTGSLFVAFIYTIISKT
jgi:hypothetical protein